MTLIHYIYLVLANNLLIESDSYCFIHDISWDVKKNVENSFYPLKMNAYFMFNFGLFG